MCRIIGCNNRCRIKSSNQKKIKVLADRLVVAYNNNSFDINNLNDESIEPPIIIHRREKSRLAAKKRRSEEGECLTELYLSLPVAPQSRLLSCDDAHFIGNFEKTTIIKVSAYVLKLYNSLSECHLLKSYNKDYYPAVSLFSQSMFGLFWCEDSSKVIFTTPGLARLTGLYWCNIIGMPLNSIILDNVDRQSLNIPSNMVFLRFMINGLKDKGIFTVHPHKVSRHGDKSQEDNNAEVSNGGLRKDIIGKMPCSIWSSTYLGGGVHFDLIQPLTTKVASMTDRRNVAVKSELLCENFRTNHDNFDESFVVFSPLFALFHIDTLETLSVDSNLIKSLGFQKEYSDKSMLYSFFSLYCVVGISKYIEKLITGESKIERCVAQLSTSRPSIYRMAVVTFQICGDKDVILPNNFNSRSCTNQGEAYSQNVINVLSSLDEDKRCNEEMEPFEKRSWIQATFQLLPKKYYDNKRNIPPTTIHRRVIKSKKDIWDSNYSMTSDPQTISPTLSSNSIRNQITQDNYYFQNNNNQQLHFHPSLYHNYYGSSHNQQQQNVSKPLTPQTSILMRELMKPK